ncbi:MAG TPA: HupE/UreJ family protein, partial [Myxococcota bacterium]|nr:HupE/UreJ family protein [Myxococcota bacterium]
MIWLFPYAWAHRPGLSYARIEGDSLVLTFAAPELQGLAPLKDLQASRLLLSAATIEKTEVLSDGVACTYGEATIHAVENDGIELRTTLDCPPGELHLYRANFLKDFEPGHRHYLEVAAQPIGVLDQGNLEATFTGVADRSEVAQRFLHLGVEHIWTGYDHLLFLAGLLLAASRLKDMLFIVTGFTVAHSITLSLAATGILVVPPEVVEPAIAASIVWVGLENLWKPPPRRRVVLTFLLGLIHGFGFAGMLAELGLPAGNLALALVCFNGGVELGQAGVVLVLLPILLLLRRQIWWERYAVPLLSLGVAAMGLY